MSIDEKVNALLGLPKSLYYNIKWFGLRKGFFLPILFGRKCIVRVHHDARITLPSNLKTGGIKIGVNYGPFGKGRGEHTYFQVQSTGKLGFEGKCNINAGSIVNISTGECTLGKQFAANAGFLLSCENQITFGDDVLLGWDCTVIDGDGHSISSIGDEKKIINASKPIRVGNHVWMGAKVTVLKGSEIAQNSIVAYGSIVTQRYADSNVLLCGRPAQIIKECVKWNH